MSHGAKGRNHSHLKLTTQLEQPHVAGEDNAFAKVDRGKKVKRLENGSRGRANYWDDLPLKCDIIKAQNNKLWSLQAVTPVYTEARQIY